MDELTKFLDEITYSEANKYENTNRNIVPDSGKDVSTDASSSEKISTNNISSYIDEGTTTQLDFSFFIDNENIFAPITCSISEQTTTSDAPSAEAVPANNIPSNICGVPSEENGNMYDYTPCYVEQATTSDALSAERVAANNKPSSICGGPSGENGHMYDHTPCYVVQATTSASGDDPTTTFNPGFQQFYNIFVLVDGRNRTWIRRLNMESDYDVIRTAFSRVSSTAMTEKSVLKRKTSSDVIDPHKQVNIHQNIRINQNSNTDVQPLESLLNVKILPSTSRGSHNQHEEEGSLYHSTQLTSNFEVTPSEPRPKKRKPEVK